MTRISDISSLEDFDVESMREDLRDQRWQRHRSMLRAIMGLLVILVLGLHAQYVLPLLKWL